MREPLAIVLHMAARHKQNSATADNQQF
ncbi:protein of unknown function [Cupriavidus taiwanensis]|uniref:Uncharacterized protein n=1 Tax=Cupriavidus taiwanensis TaxID=164546 RepID=A0A7Z7NND9_9BURK|nr:protein of unknown function [Cupriavidus taiwanensis]SPC22119.1 protein of unknown function [Cupriavidus taiwanensis]